MEFSRKRRVQRVRLAHPVAARAGGIGALLLEISTLGARIEHDGALSPGTRTDLTFSWEGEPVRVDEASVVRSEVHRIPPGGQAIYHSALEFHHSAPEMRLRLKRLVGSVLAAAVEEQKRNAAGALPSHREDRMPLFGRGGQLASALPVGVLSEASEKRPARVSGYVCYELRGGTWRSIRTYDPGQPPEGFTILADEEPSQAKLLCEAYALADGDGRRMIQLCAQLSIAESGGDEPA